MVEGSSVALNLAFFGSSMQDKLVNNESKNSHQNLRNALNH